MCDVNTLFKKGGELARMKTIKTRTSVKDIKLLDKSVNLGRRMKNSLVQVKERALSADRQAEETQDPRHASPTDYASGKIQSTAQGAAREGVHILKNPRQKAQTSLDRAKGHFQEVKRNLPKERRRVADEAQKTARTANNTSDNLRNVAEKAQDTAKNAKTAVKDAKQTLREVRREGRRTLREVRQGARAEIRIENDMSADRHVGAVRDEPLNAPATTPAADTPEIPRVKGKPAQTAAETPSKPENPAKRDFMKNGARARAENARLSGKNAAKPPDKPTVANPARSSAIPGTPGKTVNALPGDSHPNYMSRRIRPVKGATDIAKTVEKSAKTAKSTARGFKETAKGTIKTVKKSVKTAERTAKTAVKTAKQTAKAAQKTAQTTAKAAKAAAKAARAASKVAVQTAKAAVKAVTALVKAAIAAVKGLVALIAAGGWVAVLIILIICMIALLVGSVFGIFFSGEDSGNGYTTPMAIAEINTEYADKISEIRNGNAHDEVVMTGSRALWKEVLAVYAVKTSADPLGGQDVAAMDVGKKAILQSIFWGMNVVTHSTAEVTSATAAVTDDGAGNLVETEETVTKTVLYINISGKTADEMSEQFHFNNEQKAQLAELPSGEYDDLWAAVLYGIHSGSADIVAVAVSQIGNVGGQPYWSWYGFSSRAEWCACFVRWCANEAGYIDAGVIPKFAGCQSQGVPWFAERSLWQDSSYVPAPGDIIFFDWGGDGKADHVGIVEYAEGEYVHTIEGNTGDSCARRSYRLNSSSVMGYGTPMY
jgi:cell wall-associated NlpC family hydrolase